MGFNIKYNIGGTPIDNHDGGVVNINYGDIFSGYERILESLGVDDLDDVDFEHLTPEQKESIQRAMKGEPVANGDTFQNNEMPPSVLSAPARTFNQNSKFIRDKFTNAVMKYYQGKPTNLAFIIAVADDWSMLKSRNKTLDIVRTCFALGAIPYISEEDIKRINDTVKRQVNGQTRTVEGKKVKQEGLPCDYRSWTGKLADKIEFCDKIAKEFEGPGMKYKFAAK